MSDPVTSAHSPDGNRKIIIIVAAFWGLVVIALLAVFLLQSGGRSPRVADKIDLSSSDTALQNRIQPYLDSLDTDPNDINALLTIADEYLKGNKPDKAKTALERALLVDPKNVDALVMMGEACEATGRLRQAKDSLDKALSIKPSDAFALNAKAVYIANVEKDYRGALELLDKALKQAPEEPLTSSIRANIEQIKNFTEMGVGGKK